VAPLLFLTTFTFPSSEGSHVPIYCWVNSELLHTSCEPVNRPFSTTDGCALTTGSHSLRTYQQVYAVSLPAELWQPQRIYSRQWQRKLECLSQLQISHHGLSAQWQPLSMRYQYLKCRSAISEDAVEKISKLTSRHHTQPIEALRISVLHLFLVVFSLGYSEFRPELSTGLCFRQIFWFDYKKSCPCFCGCQKSPLVFYKLSI